MDTQANDFIPAHDFQALKQREEERREARDATLVGFNIELANNAGWLTVATPDKESLVAALDGVLDLTVDILPVGNWVNDRSDVYFLGETVYRSSLADVIRKLTSKRRLWWNADNADEAEQWVKELTDKGATIEKIECMDPNRPKWMMMVVFAIDPKQGERFFGSEAEIDPIDYLDEDLERL